MKILILGGNGFIGSHLVDALCKTDVSIRIFDRVESRIQSPRLGVEYHLGNFSDSTEIAEALQGVDIVYHLISTSLPSTSNLDPIADVHGNLISTIKLLEQMRELNIKKIVYLSSGGTVYGNPVQFPVLENHSLNPICSYGIVKVAIENYIFMFQQLYDFKPIILRPSNPFGPGQGHLGVQGAIPTFLKKIINNEHIQIWGDGTTIRDYIYISDLVDLCVKTVNSHETGVFNVGMGKGYSLNEIIEKIQETIGSVANVQYLPARSFDVKKITLDIQCAQKSFDWKPTVTINAGLKQYWEWMQESTNFDSNNQPVSG